MIVRALIVDDEPLARRRLRRMVSSVPDVEIAGECATGEAAVTSIRHRRPDLVFLDIQMPGMNGFEVLAALPPELLPLVVFVTAYDTYALRAFEVHAIDYVLKPTRAERVQEAIERARAQLVAGSPHIAIPKLLDAMRRHYGQAGIDTQPAYLERIAVDAGRRTYVVRVADLDWIEGADNYVRLHTRGQNYLHRSSIAALEGQLDPRQFARVHRSAIVNLDRIKELTTDHSGDASLVLENGDSLRVSRTFRPALQTALAR